MEGQGKEFLRRLESIIKKHLETTSEISFMPLQLKYSKDFKDEYDFLCLCPNLNSSQFYQSFTKTVQALSIWDDSAKTLHEKSKKFNGNNKLVKDYLKIKSRFRIYALCIITDRSYYPEILNDNLLCLNEEYSNMPFNKFVYFHQQKYFESLKISDRIDQDWIRENLQKVLKVFGLDKINPELFRRFLTGLIPPEYDLDIKAFVFVLKNIYNLQKLKQFKAENEVYEKIYKVIEERKFEFAERETRGSRPEMQVTLRNHAALKISSFEIHKFPEGFNGIIIDNIITIGQELSSSSQIFNIPLIETNPSVDLSLPKFCGFIFMETENYYLIDATENGDMRVALDVGHNEVQLTDGLVLIIGQDHCFNLKYDAQDNLTLSAQEKCLNPQCHLKTTLLTSRLKIVNPKMEFKESYDLASTCFDISIYHALFYKNIYDEWFIEKKGGEAKYQIKTATEVKDNKPSSNFLLKPCHLVTVSSYILQFDL